MSASHFLKQIAFIVVSLADPVMGATSPKEAEQLPLLIAIGIDLIGLAIIALLVIIGLSYITSLF